MIQRDVVTDLGGLADHDTGAMIDEEPLSDRGAGMNVDIGQEATEPRQQPRRKPPVGLPQAMGNTMPDQGMDAGIGEQGFELVARGGIAQADAADILPDQPQQRSRLRLDARDRVACRHVYDFGHGGLRRNSGDGDRKPRARSA